MKIVILAAGFGSRLWPLSTPEKPKQFQPILGPQSPLQYTYELFAQVAPNDDLYVLTLQGLEHLVSEQLPGINTSHVICVPQRRNTLPHTLFALNAIAATADEPLLFTPVDHQILEESTFVDSIRRIVKDKAQGLQNVTLLGNQSGIFDPNAGYFTIDDDRRVLNFKEKPAQPDLDRLTAGGARVIKDTAMFLASKQTFGAALGTFSDDLGTFSDDNSLRAQALLAASPKEREERFLALPFVDIATGFYEKATNLYADFSAGDIIDLGSFGSLYKIGTKDAQENVITGNVMVDETSKGNYIFNQTSTPLVVVKTNDSVIVQGEAGTVMAPKSDIDAVGNIYKSKIFPLQALGG